MNDYQRMIDTRLLTLYDAYREMGTPDAHARTSVATIHGERARLDRLLKERRGTPTRTDTGAF